MAQPLHVQADMLKLIKDNDSVLGVGHVNKSVLCKKVGFHVCFFFYFGYYFSEVCQYRISHAFGDVSRKCDVAIKSVINYGLHLNPTLLT